MANELELLPEIAGDLMARLRALSDDIGRLVDAIDESSATTLPPRLAIAAQLLAGSRELRNESDDGEVWRSRPSTTNAHRVQAALQLADALLAAHAETEGE